jgi:uncharacterized protein (TIGR02611 family)
MSEPEAAKPSLIERLRAQRATHKDRTLVVRLGLVVVGFTVLFAGIAMLVLPGPALAVIPVGLAILSLEFAWAARLLEVAIEKAEQAKQSAKETTATQRIIVAIAVVLGVAAIAVAVAIWGVPSWVPFVGGFNR